MTRTTSAWTDLTAVAAAGIATAVGLAYAVAAAGAAHPALVLAAAGLVTVVAVRSDAFGGMVVALFAGALVAGAQFALIGAPDGDALPWGLLFALLLVLGALSGVVGDRIRRERRRAERALEQTVAPAPGSLGLLDAADGGLRLSEEITRARLFDRPLSAVKVTVDLAEDGLSRANARRARRAVARVLENELRVTDVPCALTDRVFGIVLPETTPEAAADVVGSVLIAAAESTFADRATGRRRPVGEVVRLELGIVDARAAVSGNPRAVLDAATATSRHFDPALEAAQR